ncbi:hypothetical protein L9F63_019720, partial [Diploptera punctata]
FHFVSVTSLFDKYIDVKSHFILIFSLVFLSIKHLCIFGLRFQSAYKGILSAFYNYYKRRLLSPCVFIALSSLLLKWSLARAVGLAEIATLSNDHLVPYLILSLKMTKEMIKKSHITNVAATPAGGTAIGPAAVLPFPLKNPGFYMIIFTFHQPLKLMGALFSCPICSNIPSMFMAMFHFSLHAINTLGLNRRRA